MTRRPSASGNESASARGRCSLRTAAGAVTTSTSVLRSLIDTNVLVYRFDPRFPSRQRTAVETLRSGIRERNVVLAHQTVVEFVAAVTRPLGGEEPLLGLGDAARETEELLLQFDILYPNAEIVRLALRGAATYQLSWFDAHLWAYAEHYGIPVLLSEDYQHDRIYGGVRVVNPFLSN